MHATYIFPFLSLKRCMLQQVLAGADNASISRFSSANTSGQLGVLTVVRDCHRRIMARCYIWKCTTLLASMISV